MNYVLEWNSNNTTVSVIPVKPLSEGTRYIIAINTSLSDTYRNTLLNAFSSTFLYGLDTTPPMLSLAWETPIGSTGLLDENVINGNIPLESEIILSFNKKCIVDSIAGFIELTPSISFTTIPDLVSQDKVRLLFPKKPDWNKTYTLKIRKNITDTLGNRIENDQLFPLLFNNEKDRPITYINGWFDNNGSLVPINQNNDYGTLTLDSLYFPPLGSTVPTKLFYAFAISSQATSLSLVSAMQAISISPANSCAFVSIRTMRIWSQTEYETSTLYSLIDNSNSPHIIILETGIEIENTDKNGFLTFTIRKDIADTLHNTMQDNLTFTLNKQ
ncbi:hypothetical protein AGMMS50293_25140 [Spirochaetia bacterium]|nr:hypothetical protein AGMMS50293_25140 [Spirochaetia bacterium]